MWGHPKWACLANRLFLFLFFNWRIFALQNFVVFCHTSTRISYRYTHVPSLLSSPFHPLHIPPFNFLVSLVLRRWHPTPVLLPGKSMDGGAWWAAVHGVSKSRTRLSDFTFTFHFHALEKEMATHSSVLAWRIPRMEEPGGLLSMGLHRVRHDWSDLAAAAVWRRDQN